MEHQLEIGGLFRVAELELIYRKNPEPVRTLQVSCSITAYEVLKQTWDQNKIDLVEQFKILLLDNRNTCLGVAEISAGGMTCCPVDARIVFATALQSKTTKLILAHNHPSGQLRPSQEDIDLTDKLRAAGKLLDIKVVEHLIMTSNGYYSMADNGLIP